MQPAALEGWQQVFNGGRGKSRRDFGGCVCNRVLATSKGVTRKIHQNDINLEKLYALVKAVSVEPVAAAMSFA